MREYKFIITKDLKHFKSDYLHHYTIAGNRGYNSSDIIETGLFLEGQLYILECINKEHIIKHQKNYIGNCIYQDLRLSQWLKGRALESSYYYSIRPVGKLGEGD